MKPLITVSLLIFTYSLIACSTSTAKHVTHGILQEMGQLQCEKDFTDDCPQRQTYEEYKRSTEQ